ncbi:MAG: hypothetical protein P1U87_20775 [Verrucomicrobiales bacterium]|nr:hypothetical protein [Verrucomicrobiales bacterium]
MQHSTGIFYASSTLFAQPATPVWRIPELQQARIGDYFRLEINGPDGDDAA